MKDNSSQHLKFNPYLEKLYQSDKPLIISSGFRCAQLCLEIGSSVNSQHVADNNAAAADFEIPGVDNKELALMFGFQ